MVAEHLAFRRVNPENNRKSSPHSSKNMPIHADTAVVGHDYFGQEHNVIQILVFDIKPDIFEPGIGL